MGVRIYLPATMSDLERLADARLDLTPRRAHAVTTALRRELPEDDDEELEFAAHLAAAADSLRLIAATAGAARQRLVITADVPDGIPVRAPDDDPASLVHLSAPIRREQVVCVHVDEPEAISDGDAALRGDREAIERVGERVLLWYDVSELDRIPR